jgi:hypothetical protein
VLFWHEQDVVAVEEKLLIVELTALLDQHIDVYFVFGCKFELHKEVFVCEIIHLFSLIYGKHLDGF